MPSCSKYCAPSQELEHERTTRPADASKNGSAAAAGQGNSKPRASSELPLGPIDFDLVAQWKRDLGWVAAIAAAVGALAAIADAFFGDALAIFAGQW